MSTWNLKYPVFCGWHYGKPRAGLTPPDPVATSSFFHEDFPLSRGGIHSKKKSFLCFPSLSFSTVNRSCRFQHLSLCQISLYALHCLTVFSFLTWNLAVGLQCGFPPFIFSSRQWVSSSARKFLIMASSLSILSHLPPLACLHSIPAIANRTQHTEHAQFSYPECFPPTGSLSLCFSYYFHQACFLSLAHSSRLRPSVLKNVISQGGFSFLLTQFWVTWVHFASFYQIHFLMICLFPQ